MSSLPEIATRKVTHPTDASSFEFGTSAGLPDVVLLKARSEASAVGYANGWAQGIREARETQQALMAAHAQKLAEANARQEAEIESAVGALLAAAARRDESFDEVTRVTAEQIVSAAFSIAEALVGTALKVPEFAAPAALARVLSEVPMNEPVIVRMNPMDRAVLTGAGGSQMMSKIEGTTGRELRIQPDNAMGRGDAIAHYGDTTVDGRISAAMGRVKERLAQ